MRRSYTNINWKELGRVLRVSRKRPDPPKGLRYDSVLGLLSWEEPIRRENVTHYRIYANNERNLVRMVPVYQRYLQDNLTADRVLVTAFNLPLGLESSPAVLQAEIGPPGGDSGELFYTAGFDIPEGGDIVGPDTEICQRWDITVDGTPFETWANQADWPDPTTDTILDIRKRTPPSATWASIYLSGDANKIVIPAGQTDPVLLAANLAVGVSFARGDQLTLDAVQGTLSRINTKVLYR